MKPILMCCFSFLAFICLFTTVTQAEEEGPSTRSESSIPIDLITSTEEGSVRAGLTKLWRSRGVVSVTIPADELIIGDPLSISVDAHIEELARVLSRPGVIRLTVVLVAVDCDYVVTRSSSATHLSSDTHSVLTLESLLTVREKLDVGKYAVLAFLQASSGQEPLTLRIATRRDFVVKSRYDKAESKRVIENAFASKGEGEPEMSVKEALRNVSIDDELLANIQVPDGVVTSLDLSYSKGVTKDSVAWIAKLGSLKELKLDGCSIRANELSALLVLSNLSRIYLRNNDASTESDKAVIKQFRDRGVLVFE